jgi:hypothetical protein
VKTHVKNYSQGCYDMIKKNTPIKNWSQLYVKVKCLSSVVIFSFMIFFYLYPATYPREKLHFTFLEWTFIILSLLLCSKFSPDVDGFGGLVVSMLASGTQGHGFKPSRSRWIFTCIKILRMPSSGGEVKESVSCPSFAACQKH